MFNFGDIKDIATQFLNSADDPSETQTENSPISATTVAEPAESHSPAGENR